MTVLLRSRSLMRGVFQTTKKNALIAGTTGAAIASGCIIITHSTSVATLSEWDDYDADCDNDNNDDRELASSNKHQQRSFVIDDTTELEHQRRIETAKIQHGVIYNERSGVQTILESLTHTERLLLSDDHMPLRHYRAEKGNITEAIRKLKCTLQWRTAFGVEDIKHCFDTTTAAAVTTTTTNNDEREYHRKHLAKLISRENETGKIYVRGYDKLGRAILYLTPGRENTFDENSNMINLVYQLERAIECTKRKSGRSKIVIVIGYQGFKLSTAPSISTTRHTLTILQNHYPERMHRVYICDPPFMFRSFWNIIHHFVDATTLEKIGFCSGEEGRKLLERDFDVHTTEVQAGGVGNIRNFDYEEYLFTTPFDYTFDEK